VNDMYKYLLVILEKGAVPFCYYSNPDYYSLANPNFMPADVLGDIIDYAREKNLFLNFLYGKHQLPPQYETLIETVSHVKMIPLNLSSLYPDGVVVLEADESELFAEFSSDAERNVILRATAADLPHLSDIVAFLRGKFKRLNLHLVGLKSFSGKQLDLYEKELKKIAEMLSRLYKAGEAIEINVLSDRLLLHQMNNCNAGIQHLTIGPNGKGYICPAFYHDNEDDTVGDWSSAVAGNVKNQQLLDLDCAPVCAVCDAFHCKRCVYLNKSTTLEVNVPSREQCLTAHVEREISRQLLRSLQTTKPFDKFLAIPSITYNDPFELVIQETWRREVPAQARSAAADDHDYLAQIYEMQKAILRKLGTD